MWDLAKVANAHARLFLTLRNIHMYMLCTTGRVCM